MSIKMNIEIKIKDYEKEMLADTLNVLAKIKGELNYLDECMYHPNVKEIRLPERVRDIIVAANEIERLSNFYK